jgi:hypothetical protein
MIIGMSTGALCGSNLSHKERVALIRKAGFKAIEICFIRPHELFSGELENITAADLNPFEYVSLHAPCCDYGRDFATYAIFRAIAGFDSRARKLNTVVFHPNHVADFDMFHDAPFAYAFENMDRRGGTFKYPGNFSMLFGLKGSRNAKMVFDVTHAYTNDSSLRIAGEFVRLFAGRIVEVHISGYAGYHEPLFETRQTEIVEAVRLLDKPLIIESAIDIADIEKERDFILNAL